MEFRCLTASLADPGALLEAWQGDTLAVGLFSDPDHPARAQLASLLGPGLGELLERRRFKGKPGESVSLQRLQERPTTVILVGLGEPAGFDGNALRAATASIARAAAAAGSRSLALALPLEGLEPGAATAAMAEAVRLSLYADHRFRSEPDPQPVPELVTLLGRPEGSEAAHRSIDGLCAGTFVEQYPWPLAIRSYHGETPVAWLSAPSVVTLAPIPSLAQTVSAESVRMLSTSMNTGCFASLWLDSLWLGSV